MSENITIIGYSVDAVVEAVRQKINGNDVTFRSSGVLGEPLDVFHDMVSGRTADMIETLLPVVEFTEYHNPRHMYIPYEKVKISNSSNGVIQFPMNKNTFEKESEWEAVCNAFNGKEVSECFENKVNSPSKLLSVMKNAMPSEFVDTFIKPIGITRWRGIQLSHITMHGFTYECPFDHLGEDYSETYCRPNMTYNALCNLFLDTYDIPNSPIEPDEITSLIMNKDFTDNLVVMDNRIDAYMKYMGGRFDRVQMTSEQVKMPVQLAMAREGIYYTPYSDFWGIVIVGNDAYKMSAKLVYTLFDNFISEIPLTRTNVKMYSQYESLIKYYGANKTLDIRQRVETMIK
ncbi:MAG: hypothetical protein MJZ25_03675 [Fibrobacter sp.]|nr:hypothetical protein [Fibrobacter sp.]